MPCHSVKKQVYLQAEMMPLIWKLDSILVMNSN